MKYSSLILAALTFCLACPAPTEPPAPGADAGRIDAGATPDAGTSSDAGPLEDAGPGGDAGTDGGIVVATEENEPNDGTTPTEVNALGLGAPMQGVIGTPGDVDIFLLPTVGATLYRARLTPAPGSNLQPHLTVLDDGRGADASGADYTQLSATGAGLDTELTFFAMNEAPEDGHLIIVRDTRNVAGGSEGGADFGYTLEVTAADPNVIESVTLPYTNSHTFAHAGAAVIFSFEANEGDEALFTFSTEGDMDGRFFVVAEQSGSWIARNDDNAGNLDPRIDAPLFAEGTMFLVVDNINPNATDLNFSVSLTLNP